VFGVETDQLGEKIEAKQVTGGDAGLGRTYVFGQLVVLSVCLYGMTGRWCLLVT
jgi:hypothetical protein